MSFKNLVLFLKRYTVAHALVAGGFFVSGLATAGTMIPNTGPVVGVTGFVIFALILGLLSPRAIDEREEVE
jgi:hypothetical protein